MSAVRVTVELTALLRRNGITSPATVELPEGATVRDLVARLGYNDREQRVLRASRSNAVLEPSTRLADGDRVLLFTALGGG